MTIHQGTCRYGTYMHHILKTGPNVLRAHPCMYFFNSLLAIDAIDFISTRVQPIVRSNHQLDTANWWMVMASPPRRPKCCGVQAQAQDERQGLVDQVDQLRALGLQLAANWRKC